MITDPMPFQHGPHGDISTALEQATDEYVAACNRAAVAENAYLRAFHVAWAAAEVPATVKAKHCDNQADVVNARCNHNLAVALEKAARAKCDELKHRLMASMSWQRTVGAQT